MKVYISYEVAGAMCVASPVAKSDERTRRIVTDEVNAAIQGAAGAGADEFLVNTGCPDCDYIDLDRIDPRAEVIVGMWKPDQTMAGIDESFGALFVMSMHAKARTPRAVCAHSWDLDIYDYRVNGRSIGELGMAAYFAADYGVPTALVSGDAATCREAVELLGDVEVAPTKESLSWISARCPHPIKVLSRISQAAGRAISRLGSIRPPRLDKPVVVEIDFTKPHLVDWWTCVPTVEANGDCGVRIKAPDYRAAHRLFVLLSKIQTAFHHESGLA